MRRDYFVYILASGPKGTLYTGVTNDLQRRMWEHLNGQGSLFVQKYHVYRLVWFESLPTPLEAIHAEKRIKRWSRRWKIELIERMNPAWRDLSADWF